MTWIVRGVVIERYRRRERTLREDTHPGPPNPAPSVSILVAGKDEEENIETCVRSLLAQDYPNAEIIVINDRSTDATPEIVDRLAREAGGKLRAIHVRELPDGWYGKHHAMHLGVQASRGEWLLFTDADCRQTSPRSVSMAMQEAVKRKIDFLSVLPVLDNQRPWERWLQPVCAAILLFWFQPRKVNKSYRKEAYANGAFMLMSRRCYDAIGGHTAFRQQANEDIHMARTAKELGMKLRVIPNDGLYVAHMYRTLREASRGWARIFYGCLGTRRAIALAMAFLCFFSLLPSLSLIGSAVKWLATGAATWKTATLVWLGVVVTAQVSLIPWYRTIKTPVVWSLGYPIGGALALGILAHSFLQVSGLARTMWRGTNYRAGRRERDVNTEARSGDTSIGNPKITNLSACMSARQVAPASNAPSAATPRVAVPAAVVDGIERHA